jgi:hypothetical protein
MDVADIVFVVSGEARAYGVPIIYLLGLSLALGNFCMRSLLGFREVKVPSPYHMYSYAKRTHTFYIDYYY